MISMKKGAKVVWRRSRRLYRKATGTPLPSVIKNDEGIDEDFVLALARTACADQDHALAVLYYEKAMELWGEHSDHWLQVAILSREMGRYDEARNALGRAMRLSPADARLHLESAELHVKQKHYREAELSYRQAARMEPDWAVPATKILELNELSSAERKREAADQEERVVKAERLDLLDRSDTEEQIDPALFHPIRSDLTTNHRPRFVASFIGLHQRTRWGSGPVARGIGSLRGHFISIVPYQKVEIYIDGELVHESDTTVGPVRNERTDARLRKYAFNAWIDFSRFACGWHDVIFRAIGTGSRPEEGVNWKRESLIIDEPLPCEFFGEAAARVPSLVADGSRSLIEQIRALPSVVADASTNSYPGPVRNVAVLRLDGLGDVAVSVPFFIRLRELLPTAKIVVIASTDNADGCRALEMIDEVIEIDFPENPYRQGRFLGKEEQVALMDRLSAYRFDLAITGMVSDGPRQLAVMTGAPVTIGFGGDDLKSLNIYYDTRDPKSGANILNYAARYGMLAKALEVWLDSGARVQRREDLSVDLLAPYGIGPEDRYVVMHTGSRISATEWPGYAALANRIATELDQKVVYIANDADQKGLLHQQALLDGRIIFFAGLMPFDHFDAFLSFSSAFVGNDSGPGHLATLRGAKAIRIISARLGGSEWKSEMAGVCVFRRVPCAGCGSIPVSSPEECTFDIACVKDITVDEVFEQVLRLSGHCRAGGGNSTAANADDVVSGEPA